MPEFPSATSEKLDVARYACYIRYPGSVVLLDKMGKNLYSLFYPCSRGDSGALYSQSATARVMPSRGRIAVKQPLISDVDTWVLRNRNP